MALKKKKLNSSHCNGAMLCSFIFGKQTDAIVISTIKELIIHFITSKEFESQARSKEQGYGHKKQKPSHCISSLQPELNLFCAENVAGATVKTDGM